MFGCVIIRLDYRLILGVMHEVQNAGLRASKIKTLITKPSDKSRSGGNILIFMNITVSRSALSLQGHTLIISLAQLFHKLH